MISPNEFWLYVHRVLTAYEAEGLTPEGRTANVIEQLQEMSPIAQREIIRELRVVADRTTELHALATAELEDSLSRAAPVHVAWE